jgi:hypothetical protein
VVVGPAGTRHAAAPTAISTRTTNNERGTMNP